VSVVQYTVPWAIERVCQLLGQSLSNLNDPFSDLNGRHLLEVLNSQYQLLSSHGMAKGHPHLLRWENVVVDDNGHVENWRWNQMRGDLIGLHPRRNADDVTPDHRERRYFASMHQMGYGLSDPRNTEYEFDSAGRIRVFNSRHKWFRVWYLRTPSPLISGRADRAYECIDFKSGRLDYGWSMTDEQSDFVDEAVLVWDRSAIQMDKDGFRVRWSLQETVYRIASLKKSGSFSYSHYYLFMGPSGSTWVRNGVTTPGGFRFELSDISTGTPKTPYPIDTGGNLSVSGYNALVLPHVLQGKPTDTAILKIDLGPPVVETWVNNPYVAPSEGVMSWSILPWFPPRFMELLVYRTIFGMKRISNHQLFMKEEAEWQAAFDQWLERFDQASVPQTGVDPNSASLTEGDSTGSFIHFGAGW
jgi:hypothetical protein